MIVRQSSLTAALKLLELQGAKKPTANDVVSIAAEFEAWVLGNKIEVPKASVDDNPFEDGVE